MNTIQLNTDLPARLTVGMDVEEIVAVEEAIERSTDDMAEWAQTQIDEWIERIADEVHERREEWLAEQAEEQEEVEA